MKPVGPPHLGAEVMEHHCGQHDIEVVIRIGHRFGDTLTEFNLSAPTWADFFLAFGTLNTRNSTGEQTAKPLAGEQTA